MKHSPELEMFTTRRVAVVEGSREAAEMLHMFFRLMELECCLIKPDEQAISNIRRFDPDVLILDLDLPNLRALELARKLRGLTTLFVSDEECSHAAVDSPVLRKPRSTFEEFLRLFEAVLATDR
jgi:CheY-like chemotaxis protein